MYLLLSPKSEKLQILAVIEIFLTINRIYNIAIKT